MNPEDFFDALERACFTGPCTEPLPPSELATLREHLDQLLTQHGLTLRLAEIQWIDCYGDPEDRTIVLPRMDCELAYFVALHEIGHIALGLCSYDETGRRYENEAAVDEWAIDCALVSPSADAEEKLINFLITSDDLGPDRDEAPRRVRAACAARRRDQE